jgi:hypothetical protein
MDKYGIFEIIYCIIYRVFVVQFHRPLSEGELTARMEEGMKKTWLYMIVAAVLLAACVNSAPPPALETLPADPNGVLPDTGATQTIEPPDAGYPAPPTEELEQPDPTETLSPTIPPYPAPEITETASPEPAAAATATDAPAAATATQPAAPPAGGRGIVVDHTSIALFEQIPDEYIRAASEIRLMYRHASIGANMQQGLDCLANNFGDRRPASCGAFYNPKYDHSNWSFQFRGNPGWIEKIEDFVVEVNAQADDYDAFTFTLGYVDALDGMTYPEISDPSNFEEMVIGPVEALEAAQSDKIFIWWTIPLARLDNENTQRFNDMVRTYASENGKPLLDIADIESHAPDGTPARSERGLEIIDQAYTNESRSGHLNETGRDRMARAIWVFMAQLAGWEPR